MSNSAHVMIQDTCFALHLQDVLPLVEDLNNAGIRFVYFSSENELRSRVSFFLFVVSRKTDIY